MLVFGHTDMIKHDRTKASNAFTKTVVLILTELDFT